MRKLHAETLTPSEWLALCERSKKGEVRLVDWAMVNNADRRVKYYDLTEPNIAEDGTQEML